jgi:hypothetical protein
MVWGRNYFKRIFYWKWWMVILLKFDVKSWWKINLKSSQNYVKNDVYKMGLKIVKNDEKMTSYKLLKKWPKIDLPWGGLKLIKIDFFRSRGPGPPEMEFFEILHFFAKAPHFSTPKIDPKKGPYRKCHSPQKRLYFCSNGGVKNVTFWGVGGRTARTENCRHYYIALFDFLDILGPPFFDNFDLADPPPWK